MSGFCTGFQIEEAQSLTATGTGYLSPEKRALLNTQLFGLGVVREASDV